MRDGFNSLKGASLSEDGAERINTGEALFTWKSYLFGAFPSFGRYLLHLLFFVMLTLLKAPGS